MLYLVFIRWRVDGTYHRPHFYIIRDVIIDRFELEQSRLLTLKTRKFFEG